jgi:hypothetical protein
MKKLLSLGVVSLFIGVTAMTLSGSQDRGGNDGIRDRFMARGDWPGLKRKARTGKFTELNVLDCLSTHATATCRSR